MSKYETVGGNPSRGDTFAKIIDLIDQIIDQCAVMAHLHNTEGNDMDKLLAKGWLAMTELFRRMRYQIIQLATNKLIKH
jgi:hypothetical protein